jgi:GntR family transcriptional regulator
VVGTLAGPALPSHADLRADLVAWLGRAEAAGLAPEDVIALVETTMRATLPESTATTRRQDGHRTGD